MWESLAVLVLSVTLFGLCLLAIVTIIIALVGAVT
jgi:hypothetical protein